jgi:hypothetical protein
MKRFSKMIPLLASLLAVLSFVLAASVPDSKPQSPAATASSTVTFNRDIAPLVFQYCSPCHRPGEAAPFTLLTYEDTAKFARQIAFMTERRIMPPWLPAPGEFKFVGDCVSPTSRSRCSSVGPTRVRRKVTRATFLQRQNSRRDGSSANPT